MSCSQQQTFTAVGGCDPFSWSLSGGGTLNTYTGGEVTYTSPASNPNCTLNPTIEVTDCCGNTAQISLAVNCYNDPGMALQIATAHVFKCPGDNHLDCNDNCYPDQICVVRSYQNTTYDCNGNVIAACDTGVGVMDCWYDCESGGPLGCWSNQCGGHSPIADCGTLYDERTVEMKAAGCCPLNPMTGLPYS
jgi:hypothetical protein